MSEKMSLTRALTKLKNMQLKVDQEISSALFVGLSKNGKPTNPGFASLEAQAARIVGDYQSIEDQLSNIAKLKSAIEKANNDTTVRIVDKTYTINEALFLKKLVGYRQRQVVAMRHQLANASKQVLQSEERATAESQSALNMMFGSEKTRAQTAESSALQEAAKKTILELHQIVLHNPLDLESKIKSLQQEVDNILQEIDFALSEVNAKTEIVF